VSVIAGVTPATIPAVPDAADLQLVNPRHIGAWVQACDLKIGMHVMDDDGRWGVVAAEPALVRGARVSVPVWQPYHYLIDAAYDIEPELWSWAWRRLVRIRTPEMQRQYVQAVETAAEKWGNDRGHQPD
jgi:hypothetical protein